MTVYLIHFDSPHRHAAHYLGFTKGPVEDRLDEHRRGQGARLLQVINEAGIGWRLVRTWKGDRKLERRLKRQRHGPRLCPVCNASLKLGTVAS